MPTLITKNWERISPDYSHSSSAWTNPGPVHSVKHGLIPGKLDLAELDTIEYACIGYRSEEAKQWLSFLPRMKNLKCLDVQGWSLNKALLEVLGDMKSLVKLNLYKVTSPHLEDLCKLEQLTHLSIAAAKKEIALRPILEMDSLVVLQLGLPSGPCDMSTFENLKNSSIKSFSIASTAESRWSEMETMVDLSGFKSLDYLTLGNFKIKDRSLSFLSDLSDLKVAYIHVPGMWDSVDSWVNDE